MTRAMSPMRVVGSAALTAPLDGLLVIDKPAGPTSHDVVSRMRRVLRERRIGHTGTLDPAATGVLPLVVGRATRLARFLSAGDKCYEAEIRLGVATDTYDAAGTPVGPRHSGPWPTADELSRALDAFRGQFLQHPPAFSAKKIAGQRSYRLARQAARREGSDTPPMILRSGSDPGLTLVRPGADPLPPATVTAHSIDVTAVRDDRVWVRIHCSAGFYVRSLAHDLGTRLGIGAHLAALRRTRSGDCFLADALALEAAEADPEAVRGAIVPLDRMLPGVPAVVLTPDGVVRVRHGRDVRPADIAAAETGRGKDADALPVCGAVRLLDACGRLLAIADKKDAPVSLHPSIVLV
jgi:tRNA pseudouridine55 synthase